jgi:glycosyltransferase involved in cell wall biosynthesis
VEPQKGAAEIYELARRFPNLTFALVGAVRESVAQWDKPENVQLLGGMPHEQVLEQMDASDLFLFPSHSEGFSIALVESMARGLPAVATDVGAAADMLADGCGIVVPKGDIDAMEQAICRLQERTARKRMSAAAVEKVRRCYTLDAVMKLLVSIYQRKE